MTRTRRISVAIFVAWCFAMLAAVPASATPIVLTVGGGPEPSYNQLSLEKNVFYLRQVLEDLGAGGWPQDTFFADGGAGEHTVQYGVNEDDDLQFLGVLEALANSGGYNGTVTEQYRKTELTGLKGPATAAALTQWFNTTGAAIPAHGELLFYYTGHGGGDNGRANPPRNTTLSLWDKPSMTMRQFASLLDKTDPSVTVMLVMVQCHSGGFANVIYKDGEPRNGLSKQLRFGFFATSASRIAAGCTPDIRGEDYREFSTAFFAALSGRTRTGKAVEKPDYAHAGKTTYMDAFTYVLLTSDTVDLPMTTSDQLLRDFSRYDSSASRNRSRYTTAPTTAAASQPVTMSPRLLPANARYSEIEPLATPAERAAITGLAKILELDKTDPLAGARALLDRVDRQRRSWSAQNQSVDRQYETAREKLRHAVYMKWPELADAWLPANASLRDKANLPALKSQIRAMPEYKAFTGAAQASQAQQVKLELLERKWIKAQRLIDRAETVILRANLSRVASPEVQKRFQELTEHENGTITAEHF
jgi:hypothetical protein